MKQKPFEDESNINNNNDDKNDNNNDNDNDDKSKKRFKKETKSGSQKTNDEETFMINGTIELDLNDQSDESDDDNDDNDDELKPASKKVRSAFYTLLIDLLELSNVKTFLFIRLLMCYHFYFS